MEVGGRKGSELWSSTVVWPIVKAYRPVCSPPPCKLTYSLQFRRLEVPLCHCARGFWLIAEDEGDRKTHAPLITRQYELHEHLNVICVSGEMNGGFPLLDVSVPSFLFFAQHLCGDRAPPSSGVCNRDEIPRLLRSRTSLAPMTWLEILGEIGNSFRVVDAHLLVASSVQVKKMSRKPFGARSLSASATKS